MTNKQYCPKCGNRCIPCTVPPTIFEVDGLVWKCPECGWNDFL